MSLHPNTSVDASDEIDEEAEHISIAKRISLTE
jgi:hypothetical protein